MKGRDSGGKLGRQKELTQMLPHGKVGKYLK